MEARNNLSDKERLYYKLCLWSQYFCALAYFIGGLVDPLNLGFDFTMVSWFMAALYAFDAFKTKFLPSIVIQVLKNLSLL